MSTGSQASGNSSTNKRVPFAESYLTLCRDANISPLVDVKAYLGRPILELSADKIKLDDWKLLLKALAGDRSLHYIAVKSKHTDKNVLEQMNTETTARVCKRPVLYTKFVMTTLAESLSKTVSVSRNLSSLLLSSIPIKSEYLNILCEGIGKNKSLQHLALQHCPVFDNGCCQLCKILQNKSNLITLDMTDCGITDEGAAFVAELIKMQSTARFGESWKCSLRYSSVDSAELPGLRRITLNQNSSIGDKGLKSIVEVLYDDIWIRAMDMQQCGITEKGCESVVELIKTNKELEIFDLRANNLHDFYILRQLMDRLKENLSINNGKFKFRWMDEVKDLGSSLSQMSLVTAVQQTPRRHSHLNTLPNAKSEVSFKSMDSDAPWRTAGPKPKSMFTLNKRKKARSSLTRSKSMEPITWSSQASIRGRAKKNIDGSSLCSSSHRLDNTEEEVEEDEEEETTPIRGMNKLKTFVGVGVTEEQYKILNEFKQYSAAWINPQNKSSEEQHQEQPGGDDNRVNRFKPPLHAGDNPSNPGSKSEEKQPAGSSNLSQVPCNRAQELFSKLLLRKQSSGALSNVSEISAKTISLESPNLSLVRQESLLKVTQAMFRLGPGRAEIKDSKSSAQSHLEVSSSGEKCFNEVGSCQKDPSLHPLLRPPMAACLRPDPEELRRRDMHPLRATVSSVLLRPEDPLRRELQMTSSAVTLSHHLVDKRS